MDKEIKFKSLNELYKRLYPALNTKRNELARQEVLVSELDIWHYLKETLWDNKESLNLCDMVNNILNLKEKDIITYLREKRQKVENR